MSLFLPRDAMLARHWALRQPVSLSVEAGRSVVRVK